MRLRQRRRARDPQTLDATRRADVLRKLEILVRLLQGHRLGRRERGELPHGVADDEVRLHTAFTQGCEHGERRRDERRLLHRGVHELLCVGVEAEALEIEAGRRTRAPEDVHRGGHRLREVAAHAGLERALAREAERDLAHCESLSVQRISALPQVRPAPIPVMSTSLPGRSLPSACASASARGIEPDEVLP